MCLRFVSSMKKVTPSAPHYTRLGPPGELLESLEKFFAITSLLLAGLAGGRSTTTPHKLPYWVGSKHILRRSWSFLSGPAGRGTAPSYQGTSYARALLEGR